MRFSFFRSRDTNVQKSKLILFLILSINFGKSPVYAQKSNLNKLQDTETLIKQNPDEAFSQIRRLLNDAINKEDLYTTAICYEQIGELFYYQAAYSQALDNYYKADNLFRKENFPAELAGNLNKIGETYYYNRQYTIALKTFREALDIYKKLNSHKGVADSYGFIGQTYEKTHDYSQAFNYQHLALLELKKEKDQTGIAKIYENLGSIYEDKLQLDSALKYFTLSLERNKLNGFEMGQIEVINNIGDVYRKTGKHKTALLQTREAAKLAKEMGESYQLASAYRDLSKTFDLMGRHDSAYYYSEAGRAIFVSIFSEDNKKQLLLLQMLFETEQKDNAIKQFEKDKKISNIIYIAAVLIIILLVCLGFSIISKQRLKIRNTKKLNEQKNKLYETKQKAMEVDLHNKLLKEENLKGELELKNKELTSHTLHLIQKNQLLEELKAKLNGMVKDDKRDQRKELKQLISLINFNNNQDKNWDDFRIVFERVHEHFFDSLKKHSNGLTSSDFRLVALLKMNLSSADISTLLGISQDSLRISRYRLRKKLNLEEGENLTSFIQNL